MKGTITNKIRNDFLELFKIGLTPPRESVTTLSCCGDCESPEHWQALSQMS